MTAAVEVIACLNISALANVTTVGVLATGSTAIVANLSSPTPPVGPGGQGATFFFIAGSKPDTPNGVSVVNAVDNGGQWLLIESDGPAVNVLAFGADPTGTNDSTAAFQAALATQRSVFVSSGTYLLSGTLTIQYPGQVLYGPQPYNPTGSGGVDGGATLAFSGTGLAYCIHITPASGSQINWAGIRDLSIDCTGVTPSNTTPTVAIQVDEGYHVTLDNLYIVNPVNGIVVNGSNTTHIHRVVMNGTIGGFNYKLTGSSSGNTEVVVMTDCNSSGVPTSITTTTTAAASAGATTLTLNSVTGITTGMTIGGTNSLSPTTQVTAISGSTITISPGVLAGNSIPSGTELGFVLLPTASSSSAGTAVLSSVTGIYPGMLVSGSGVLPGTQVVSVTTATKTITLFPGTTTLPLSTPLRFGTIGLWVDSYCTSVQGEFLRNKTLMTALYLADTQSSSGEPPSDVWIFDLGGDFLTGDFVVNHDGADVYLLTPSIYGGSSPTGGGGRGIYFASNANNMSVIGGRVAAALYEGISLYGGGFYIQGCFIGQNGQAAADSYDGILINSSATRVRIADNQIGYLSTTSGQQRYGINNDGAPYGDIIVDGNDLRGNATAPVNDASKMVLGTNLGIAGSGRSVNSTSPATITATDTYVGLTNTGTNLLTVNLPASPTFNQVVTIKDEGGTAGTHAFHVTPATGTIEGASYVALTTNYGAVTVRYNGTSWFVLSNGT